MLSDSTAKTRRRKRSLQTATISCALASCVEFPRFNSTLTRRLHQNTAPPCILAGKNINFAFASRAGRKREIDVLPCKNAGWRCVLVQPTCEGRIESREFNAGSQGAGNGGRLQRPFAPPRLCSAIAQHRRKLRRFSAQHSVRVYHSSAKHSPVSIGGSPGSAGRLAEECLTEESVAAWPRCAFALTKFEHPYFACYERMTRLASASSSSRRW